MRKKRAITIAHVYGDFADAPARVGEYRGAQQAERLNARLELRRRAEQGTMTASTGLLSTYVSLIVSAAVSLIAAVNLVMTLRGRGTWEEGSWILAGILGLYLVVLVVTIGFFAVRRNEEAAAAIAAIAAAWLAEYERAEADIAAQSRRGRIRKHRRHLL